MERVFASAIFVGGGGVMPWSRVPRYSTRRRGGRDEHTGELRRALAVPREWRDAGADRRQRHRRELHDVGELGLTTLARREVILRGLERRTRELAVGESVRLFELGMVFAGHDWSSSR